jgi:hypothetical protein
MVPVDKEERILINSAELFRHWSAQTDDIL